VSTTTASSGEQQGPALGEGASAEKSYIEPTSASHRPGTETPTTPAVVITPSDPWSSFTRTNAWDDNPQIERYVDNLQQKHRRTTSGGTAPVGRIQMPATAFGTEDRGTGSGEQEPWRRRGSKLTDFPSEVDRPSLPVTPAPIRRPKFWGGGAPGILGPDDLGGDDSTSFGDHSGGDVGGLAQIDRKGQQLPAAQGVPTQSDWVCVHGNIWGPADCLCDLANALRSHKDPVAQLQKLARQQSELLLQKLGHGGSGGSGEGGPAGTTGEGPGRKGEIPSRSMPFGSENIKSPTYVPQSAPVFSPKPVKPESSQGSVEKILGSQDATPRISVGVDEAIKIEEPSYKGPGVMYEKEEDYPVEETPALPTEEEMDALEVEDSRLEA
jgi:glycogenin